MSSPHTGLTMISTSRIAVRTGSALHGGLLSSCLPKKKVTKEEGPPTYGPALRCAALRVRSFHRRSMGTLRRAVPGPSQLSRHPCRSTPSAPILLTLLMGFTPARTDLPAIQPRASARNGCIVVGAKISPSAGRVEVLRRGMRGRDAEQGTMGHGCPFETTPGAMPERGKSQRSEDPYAGACFFCLLFFARAKKSKAPEGAQSKSENTRSTPLAQPKFRAMPHTKNKLSQGVRCSTSAQHFSTTL